MIDLLIFNGKNIRKLLLWLEKSRNDELCWKEGDVVGEGGC